jgi:hypothetical protein
VFVLQHLHRSLFDRDFATDCGVAADQLFGLFGPRLFCAQQGVLAYNVHAGCMCGPLSVYTISALMGATSYIGFVGVSVVDLCVDRRCQPAQLVGESASQCCTTARTSMRGWLVLLPGCTSLRWCFMAMLMHQVWQ